MLFILDYFNAFFGNILRIFVHFGCWSLIYLTQSYGVDFSFDCFHGNRKQLQEGQKLGQLLRGLLTLGSRFVERLSSYGFNLKLYISLIFYCFYRKQRPKLRLLRKESDL